MGEVKTYKTKELYTKLYGKKAYDEWAKKENEITAFVLEHRVSVRQACKMREDNFRAMKASEIAEVA